MRPLNIRFTNNEVKAVKNSFLKGLSPESYIGFQKNPEGYKLKMFGKRYITKKVTQEMKAEVKQKIRKFEIDSDKHKLFFLNEANNGTQKRNLRAFLIIKRGCSPVCEQTTRLHQLSSSREVNLKRLEARTPRKKMPKTILNQTPAANSTIEAFNQDRSDVNFSYKSASKRSRFFENIKNDNSLGGKLNFYRKPFFQKSRLKPSKQRDFAKNYSTKNSKLGKLIIRRNYENYHPSRAFSPTYETNKESLSIKKTRTNMISPLNNHKPLLGSFESIEDPKLAKKRFDRKLNLSNLISDEEITQIREKIWAKLHGDQS
ncbi:unnamed protein product [Moneuplotes crassus]|uniref:Uncharacterized protein n=1 Tax=Euplotes crassus TaxID=5936 RepID=A0AAD1X3W7_EUPCR|nr:unnamed protein product [Moneuplotes crassus]